MSINRSGALIIAGAALLCVVALARPAWQHWNETPPPPPATVRATLPPSEDVSPGAGPDHPFGAALAPDGRRLAFPATRSGTSQLWQRDLSSNEIQPLPGTEDGTMPFWSTDGSQLGFFAGGRLKVLSLASAQVNDVTEAPAPRGGAWLPNGNIVFAPRADSGLVVWHADGSGVAPLTTLDTATGESSHRFPTVVTGADRPGQPEVVYLVQSTDGTRSGLWTTSGVRLTASDANALGGADWLVFSRGDALLAQRIDWRDDSADKPALVGTAQLLGTAVGRSPLGQLSASLSGDALVYGAPQPQLRELRWIDRDGTQSTLASEVQVADVRIAPTGGRVAVTQLDAQLGTLDIWIYEGGRLLPRRLSQALDVDESPVWSPDATRLVWVQARRNLASRGAQAQLPEQTLRKFEAPIKLWDWTSDARAFVIGQTRPGTRDDLLIAHADDSPPIGYATGPFNEIQAHVSPDGLWLAYASDESGQPEIYLDSFPTPGRRARLTTGGGSEPRWPAPRPDQNGTREVYFKRGSEIHVVTVSFAADRPEPVSTARLFDAGGEIRAFDVSRDSQRFLVNVPSPGARVRPINLVVNWKTLLK